MSEDAVKRRRYGAWAGSQGSLEDLTRCHESVCKDERGAVPYQCQRKRGHGPDGKYCKTHALKYATEPIATWYRTDSYSFEVVPVDVFKESEKTITTSMGRTDKRGYHDYWPTREAAIEHLRTRLDMKRNALAQAEKDFAKTAGRHTPSERTGGIGDES